MELTVIDVRFPQALNADPLIEVTLAGIDIEDADIPLNAFAAMVFTGKPPRVDGTVSVPETFAVCCIVAEVPSVV